MFQFRLTPLAMTVALASFVSSCTDSKRTELSLTPDSGTGDSNAAEHCELDTNFTWTASERLIDPVSDANHDLVAIKDPSVVFFEDRWHVVATTANTSGDWSLVYLNFDRWENAKNAEHFYLDQVPGLDGYHAAPHVFYFRPHEKWYLIYQSQQPQYSTTDDISRPETWSEPQNFFEGKPLSAPDLWIDYWVICDETHCYLFFTGDDGGFYRSQTRIEDFPQGMSDPVTVIRQDRYDLFEGSATYKLDGLDKYLTITEGIGGPDGARYYKAWVADTLDGHWTPWTGGWDYPFAGAPNVSFEGTPWTVDISHGELLRSGYDERMTLKPCDMQLLFQGRDPNEERDDYSQLPYGLGLLTQGPSDPNIPPLDADPVHPPSDEPRGPADQTGNLITNSGFEENTDGWVVWAGEIATTTDQAHSGERSGVVTGRSDTWNGAVWNLLRDVVAGEEYTALAWVTVSEGTEPVSISTKAVCGSEERYEGVATAEVSAGQWQELRGTFRAPLCPDLQEFVIYIEGPAAGIDLYLDDVVVAHSSVDVDALLGLNPDAGVPTSDPDAGAMTEPDTSTMTTELEAGAPMTELDGGAPATDAEVGGLDGEDAGDASLFIRAR